MWTITVGTQEHALAVVAYTKVIGCTSAKVKHSGLHKWYRIEIECELKHRRSITGFVDGLEWFQHNK